jgi:hypothetical protein
MERQAMRLGSILAPCAAVALAAAPVRADELPHALRLEYIRGPGAETCPDENSFHTLVFMQYGSYDVFKANAPTRFVVTFRRNAGRLEGNMVATDDASGALVWKRTVPARSACAGLAEELAFLISFYFLAPKPPAPPAPAMPPPAVLEPATPPPAAPPPVPAPPAAPPRSAPARPPPEPLRLTLGLAGALTLKTAPPIFSGSLSADAGIRWGSASLTAEFRWTPASVLTTDETGRAQVRAMQYVGALVPCYHGGAFVCGLAEVLIVSPQALPPVVLRSVPEVGFALGARVGKDLQLAGWPVAFRVTGDLVATLYSVAARSRGSFAAWSALGLAATAGLGVVWNN